MNGRQTRAVGWTLTAIGCLCIVLSRAWLGLAFVLLGLMMLCVGARCPHCGKHFAALSPYARICPRCRNII